MALPIEGMDREQLTEKRQRTAVNIQLLKADTPEKIVQEGFTVLQKRENIAVYDKSQ
jgi:hypothetical protein